MQHVMERVSFVQRARLGTGTSEASGAPRQPLNAATQDGVDLQEVRSGLLHELPDLSEVLRCARRHRGSRTGARHDDRQGSDSGRRRRATNRRAQKAAPKKPSQLEQARTALQNAKSAGLPQAVIASLEHEVEKLVVLTAEARPIGAQIDAAKARLARALKAEGTTEGTLDRARGASESEPAGEKPLPRHHSRSSRPKQRWNWREVATTITSRQLWNKFSNSSNPCGLRDMWHRE